MMRLPRRRMLRALPLAAGLALSSAAADAHTFIVGLAADCVPPTQALSERLMRLFMDLHGGDELVVYDAPGRTAVARIAIPANRPAYDRPAVRIRQFGADLVKIRRFLESRCGGGPTATLPPGNLAFPEFLEEISRVVIPSLPRGAASVLVAGSALYNDPRDPALSMLDGHYPSDAHLSARRTDSVYSTAGKAEALAGVDVHYCYTDASWLSDAHKESVLRWWSLFVGTQQGTLATFTNDLGTCLERFDGSVTAGAPSFRPEAEGSGREMLLAKRSPVVREVLRPAPPATSAAASPPPDDSSFLGTDTAVSRERPAARRALAKIGIRWTCPGADLDIYARGGPASEFLFYGNTSTPEGHFPHDYQQAPGDASALEYVEFTRPIDLETAEAFVNFYGGSCTAAPSGIVRLWFDNKVYEGQFALAATHGNQGARSNGRMTGPYWARIDLKKLAHWSDVSARRTAGRPHRSPAVQ
jgi:hypothetical protein